MGSTHSTKRQTRQRKWVRASIATLPILVAALALAGLLAISTQPGDADARRLDQALRQAAALAPRIVERAAAASTDVGDEAAEAALVSLDDALGVRMDVAGRAFEALHPAQPDLLARTRERLVHGFDVLEQGPTAQERAEALRRRLGAADATAVVFRTRTEALRGVLARWQRLERFIETGSRELVAALRARGEGAAADRVFSAVNRLRGGSAGRSTLSAEARSAILLELESEASAGAVVPGDGLLTLVEAMRDLPGARAELLAARASLEASPLPSLLGDLREEVSADLLGRLATIGDARILLNVYTALLLLTLVWFGLRLRASHAALGRANASLEQRVAERTSELVQANVDLKESQVQLVQAEKMSSLGQLVAGVMHEVNTPLMYVHSNVETCAESISALAREFSPAVELARSLRRGETDKQTLRTHLSRLRAHTDPEEVDVSLQEIDQLTADTLDGLGQISELVQSLKDFSRLDRADEDLFDVTEGLERTLTITRNLLKYGIEVVRDYEDVPQIRCAPSRLNQVFINLVTNAVQAMDGAGRLELSVRDLGSSVQIGVSDTGCGIPPENLQKITDPFFTTKPVGQGTGLGLSIVRQIVDEHEGRLDIESAPGVGTTMLITLPVERGRSADDPGEAEPGLAPAEEAA